MSTHEHAHEDVSMPVEVLSVSKKNPKVRTIRVARPSPEQAAYLIPTLKGLQVTMRHFFRNVLFKKDVVTIQYPDEDRPHPPRLRGEHRLMKREDGEVRCVACMMCPTVCPAHCITIIPEASPNNAIEKRPAVFEIDSLRCVLCGLCVEACPCDAIRMDTRIHTPPVEKRADAIYTKDRMMKKGELSTARQGGAGPDWRDE
jgi:NADH-quinone oxidoreductase subunit I